MEIEAAFADSDDFLRRGEVAQLRDSFGGAVLGVMRMHADGGKYVFVTLGDRDRQPVAFDRADCADRDDLRDAGVRCAPDHVFDVVAELRIRQMAMRINDHCHSN